MGKSKIVCNYTASRQDIRFLVYNYACVLNSEKSDGLNSYDSLWEYYQRILTV